MIFLSLSVYFSLQHTYNILHDFDDFALLLPLPFRIAKMKNSTNIYFTHVWISVEKKNAK